MIASAVPATTAGRGPDRARVRAASPSPTCWRQTRRFLRRPPPGRSMIIPTGRRSRLQPALPVAPTTGSDEAAAQHHRLHQHAQHQPRQRNAGKTHRRRHAPTANTPMSRDAVRYSFGRAYGFHVCRSVPRRWPAIRREFVRRPFPASTLFGGSCGRGTSYSGDTADIPARVGCKVLDDWRSHRAYPCDDDDLCRTDRLPRPALLAYRAQADSPPEWASRRSAERVSGMPGGGTLSAKAGKGGKGRQRRRAAHLHPPTGPRRRRQRAGRAGPRRFRRYRRVPRRSVYRSRWPRA